MILTFTAPEDQPAYRIDAGALNNELAAALGGWCNGWSASHNATQAIVTLEDETLADTVAKVVAAHIANTDTREWNKSIEKQILDLEGTVTQRMLREAALGDTTRLKAHDAAIAALRAQRK